MKKKMFSIATSCLLVLFVSLSWHSSAQCIHDTTLVQPVGGGDETLLLSSDGCTPPGSPSPYETRNFYGFSDQEITEWTINGIGCNDLHGKALIRFAQMSSLPPNAIIIYAELRLKGVPNSTLNTLGNSWHPGTPFLDNAGTVYMVNGSAPNNWIHNTVTWNTAPLTAGPVSPIPVTTTQWNNDFNIDVTAITNQIWINMHAALLNNGYLLSLNATNHYRSTLWASSFNTHSLTPPSLYIKYYLPCNANFNYCSSTTSPNTYNFTAQDPGSCYAYVWDYGDGSPLGFGINTVHTYTNPGTYNACLMLKDPLGNIMCQQCTILCVNQTPPPPTAAPALTPTPVSPSPSALTPASVAESTPTIAMDNTINIIGVSPNPSHTWMDVNLYVLRNGNVHYNVYDMQGRLIIEGDNVVAQGSQKFSLSVGKLAPGNYILELKDIYSTIVKTKFTKE